MTEQHDVKDAPEQAPVVDAEATHEAGPVTTTAEGAIVAKPIGTATSDVLAMRGRLPRGWDEKVSAQGERYYVNIYTKVTSWDFPTLPESWKEVIHESGRPYYQGPDGVCTWDWPFKDPAPDKEYPEQPDLYQVAKPKTDDDALEKANQEREEQIGQAIWLSRGLGQQDHPMPDVSAMEWNALKKHYADHRFAQNQLMPLRKFCNSTAMNPNEWDKQVDLVCKRKHKLMKLAQALGHKEELDNPYLLKQFPIIQRLQYTKWPPAVLFWEVFRRACPSLAALTHGMMPSMEQKAALLGVHLSCVVLLNCIHLAVEVPMVVSPAACSESWGPGCIVVDPGEIVPALERSLPDILQDLGSNPPELALLVVVAIASEHVARLVMAYCAERYHDKSLTPERLEAMKHDHVKGVYMREEHSRGNKLYFYFLIGTGLSILFALIVSSLRPQKRCAVVVQGLLMTLLYGYYLLPFLAMLVVGTVLLVSTKSGVTDGLLSAFPSLLDFAHVGVETPEFLAWRLVQMEREEEILEHLYEEGGLVRELAEQREREFAAMDAGKPKSGTSSKQTPSLALTGS